MNEPGENPPADAAQSGLSKKPMNWRRFVILLLSPSILALFTSLTGSMNFPVLFTMFGSVAVGVVCGIELGVHLAQRSRSIAVAVLLSFFVLRCFHRIKFYALFRRMCHWRF